MMKARNLQAKPLSPETLNAIADAGIKDGLALVERDLRVRGLPPELISAIARHQAPGEQMLADLSYLNDRAQDDPPLLLTGGKTPLALYLSNCIHHIKATAPRRIFSEALAFHTHASLARESGPDTLMQAWHGVRGPAADLAATVTEMPFHGAGRIAYVQQDYVPITIEFEDAPNLPSDGLDRLLDEHFVPSSPVRWLITGGAGSGKTTLCRYLILRWSTLHGHDDVEWGEVRYVPWLLNLDAFAGEGQGVDPFKWAVREYSRTFGDHDVDTLLRLEEGLRALARAGLLVLVFDGYDELKPDHSQFFHALIEGLKRRWKALSIVVLSRPLGASDRFVAGEWRRASLRPLDAAAQRALLERSGRAKVDAEKLLNRLTESMDASERRIMHNPLLLTLAAQIEGRIVESRWRTEFEILDAIIELSLATALRGSTQTEREAFRQVLMCVALVLARRDEFFSREALVEIIEAHLDRVRSVIVATARSAKGFLGHCKSCGLLKRSEQSDSWRFSHHAIRDHLAVLALLDDPEKLMEWFAETTGPRAASGGGHEGDLRALPRALAMAIRRMGAGGLRALAQDHPRGRGVVKELNAFLPLPSVRMPTTASEISTWIDDLHDPDGDRDRLIEGARTMFELAIIDAALVHRGVEVPVDLLREQAGRVLKLRVPWRPPAIERVPIPHNSDVQHGTPFGSSRDEQDVPAFSLGRFPVTLAQYRTIDPRHQQEIGDDEPDLPATEVDWWMSRLFARLVGGELPTEREWEIAARGGHETSAIHTESISLEEIAWFGENADDQPHPVGGKRGNGYELHDMLGNVAEWCRVEGSVAALDRPIRGGCFRSSRTEIGPSVRSERPSTYRGIDVGFRVRFPMTNARGADHADE